MAKCHQNAFCSSYFMATNDKTTSKKYHALIRYLINENLVITSFQITC